jgi:hypothetical protein
MSETIKKNLNEKEINFALEEYKTLRAEISSKMDNQYKILSLGIGGITVIFGAILKTGINELFIAMPFLVIANAFLYRTEYVAMINAGRYIKEIENFIYDNHTKPDKSKRKGWENYLSREVYKPFNYVADIIFMSLYFLSVIKVVHYICTSNILCNEAQKIVALIIYSIVILFLFIRYLWLIYKFREFLNDEKNSGKY